MSREEWLKAQIGIIKAGGDMRMSCVMATPDRIELGLCQQAISTDRVKRGLDTCSPECQADKKRLARWQRSKGCCRLCGHSLPKKRREDMLRKAQEG